MLDKKNCSNFSYNLMFHFLVGCIFVAKKKKNEMIFIDGYDFNFLLEG